MLKTCVIFGCIEGLRAKALCSIIQCSAVLLGSLFGVIVTGCICQLDFNKDYYYYYYYYPLPNKTGQMYIDINVKQVTLNYPMLLIFFGKR